MYPIKALGIRAAGMSCAQAEDFVRSAHGPCKLGHCRLNGFVCKDEGAFTSTVLVRCDNGAQHLKWAWFGGY